MGRIPLLAEEGWRGSQQAGAPGAKRELIGQSLNYAKR